LFDFERPRGGENALLVHVFLPQQDSNEDLHEFTELVRSAGVNDAELVTTSRHSPLAKTFIGSGKLEEIRVRMEDTEIDVVLFNHALSPSQERNLERELKCRVLDRTGLILDIFAQRAQSHEGKLQVELAQLKHLSTRLVRGWTHLERQKGGIGLRGPGETQLETDRRLLGKRIKSLHQRLQKVQQQRLQSRQARKKNEIPTVALVGYTNAGKSTLFNSLTEAKVYAQDQLFATLDPTLRKLPLDNRVEVILADTVGFIRHLPHDLVAAFRSTLLETAEADLILHVADIADPDRHDKALAVAEVLAEIGAAEVPQLKVLNKIDLPGFAPQLDRDEAGRVRSVKVSAHSGAGLDLLRQALLETFSGDLLSCSVMIEPQQGGLRAELYRLGVVDDEHSEADGRVILKLRLNREQQNRLLKKYRLEKHFFASSALSDTVAAEA